MLIPLLLHASITLTVPYSLPVPNGSGALVSQSLTTVACEGVDVDVAHGVATEKCFFCNDTVNAGKEVSCIQIAGTSPFFLQLVHATCVLTITYQGQSVGGITYAATPCASAWTFDTTQPANAIQNATELLLLPSSGGNPSGLGVFTGGGTQGATW